MSDTSKRKKLSQVIAGHARAKQAYMMAAQSDLLKRLGPSLFAGDVSHDQVQRATVALRGKHSASAIADALVDIARKHTLTLTHQVSPT